MRAAQATTSIILTSSLYSLGLTPQRLDIFPVPHQNQPCARSVGLHAGCGAVCITARLPAGRYFGQLGPKRHTGDYQVPEGFYEIYRFNPRNNFHLSLGRNYPNAADRTLGEPAPGSDIFIHGGAVTMSYLPITDAGIEEIYLLTVMARAAGYPGSYFPVSDNESGVG